MNAIEMIGDGTGVKFIRSIAVGPLKTLHTKTTYLWYKTECGYEFPIPSTDIRKDNFKTEQDKIPVYVKWLDLRLNFPFTSKE